MAVVALFVPGDRPDRFAKAAAAGADRVIIDCEDAVAPTNKPAAREATRAALAAGFRACVRINPPNSPEGAADLAALAAHPPLAVLVPKVGDPADIAGVRAVLPHTPVIALIESIAGIRALERIAAADGVEALAFGAYDLCAELGARVTAEVLATWRSLVVLAARSANVAAIDTPYLDLQNEPGLGEDSYRAVDFGFDGKLAIHPKQIAVIRAAFMPDFDEIARARAIVAAGGEGGASVLGGAMIDAPIIAAARRVIDRAGG
ncbi:MAG: CoA ester lyase [Candidatus Velthaea sp.]